MQYEKEIPPQRVCVIGLGPIGNRHADIYQENPLAELVGVCHIRKGRAACAGGRTEGLGLEPGTLAYVDGHTEPIRTWNDV